METAVEYLFNKLQEQKFITKSQLHIALLKERDQIIESYCQGCFDITKDDSIFPREKSEQYYNETFNR